MCLFDGGDGKTSRSGPDELTQRIRQMILPFAFQIANQSFPGYDAYERVQGFSPDQMRAFGKVRSYASDPTPGYYNWAQGQAHDYANARAGHIDTSRVVDQKGPLGSIKSYMDPYVGRVVGSQIRNIGDAAERQRNDIGAQSTFAGAFGDARQGVAESLTNREEQRAIGDVTGQGYSQAFDRAMGMRANDLDRFMSRDTLNANLREQALGRKLAGGQASMGFGLQNSQDYMQRLNALMNSGKAQQQYGQNIKDAKYENYKRGVEWPFRQWDVLLSMLSGQPTTQVTETQGGGNGIWGILGNILGGFL